MLTDTNKAPFSRQQMGYAVAKRGFIICLTGRHKSMYVFTLIVYV